MEYADKTQQPAVEIMIHKKNVHEKLNQYDQAAMLGSELTHVYGNVSDLNTKALIMTHDLQTYYDLHKILEEILEQFNTNLTGASNASSLLWRELRPCTPEATSLFRGDCSFTVMFTPSAAHS